MPLSTQNKGHQDSQPKWMQSNWGWIEPLKLASPTQLTCNVTPSQPIHLQQCNTKSKIMIQSKKKIVNRRKEHVEHARIMETKGVAILALRHWDSPKIKHKPTNICWHKKMVALWRTSKLPQKNCWSHAPHHSSGDGE
jgi:hypothetical protein